MIKTLKRDWRAILIQSVVTTVVMIAIVWALAFFLGSIERDARVDASTAQIVQEVRSVRTLLCEALSLADNDELAQAVEENCQEYRSNM